MLIAGVVVAAAMLVSAQLAFNSGVVTLVVAPLVALFVGGRGRGADPARRSSAASFARCASASRALTRPSSTRSSPTRGSRCACARMAIGPESVIAGYRIVSLIGRGGMGVVYEAVQLTLERPVALKLIDPARADDEEFRARFVRESHVAAGLEHPHVIPVYEAREDDRLLFIAMRLVRGPSLADVLASQAPLAARRRRPAWSRRSPPRWARRTQRGLVHRDVKPANVLLHEREHAYLTDFGVTRELGGDGLTAAGERIGTVDYMAPEQARGERGRPGRRHLLAGLRALRGAHRPRPVPGGERGRADRRAPARRRRRSPPRAGRGVPAAARRRDR